jgi:hypothetical protein
MESGNNDNGRNSNEKVPESKRSNSNTTKDSSLSNAAKGKIFE